MKQNIIFPKNAPDELAQHVSKKKNILFGRIIPPFCSKVQNLTVFSIIYMIRIRFFGRHGIRVLGVNERTGSSWK